ncbi:MAG: VCBS repeat-containing protein, partial [Chloroflexota bacterium]|nr:VCBS repeat-containing protein [Chloroflexota bacterium]
MALVAGMSSGPTPLWAADIADIDIPLSGAPPVNSVPVVLDLDGDGVQELVLAGEDGILYLVSGNTNAVVWQKNLAEYLSGYGKVAVEAGLAAGDLEGDGQIEVVIATG